MVLCLLALSARAFAQSGGEAPSASPAGFVPVKKLASWITAAEFAPDSAQIAITGQVADASAPTALLQVPDLTVVRQLAPFQDQVCRLSYSLDGTLLAAGGRMGYLGVWDLKTGSLVQQFLPHYGIVDLQVSLLADSRQVYLEGAWRTGQVVDWTTGQIVKPIAQDQGARHVALSADRTLVAHDDQGMLAVDRLADGRRVFRLDSAHNTQEIRTIALSGDGTRVAAVRGRHATIHQIEGGKELRRFEVPYEIDAVTLFWPDLKWALVSEGRQDPQGEKLAVYDVEQGKVVATINSGCRRVLGLTLSPDGKHLFTWGFGGGALLARVE